MAAAAVATPIPTAATTTSPAQKPAPMTRHKDTVRVSALTNRPIGNTTQKIDVYWCEPCKMKLTNPMAQLKHFTGKPHTIAVSRVKAKPTDLKRKQDPKVAAPPAKVAKTNNSGAGGAGGAKKKPVTTTPVKNTSFNKAGNRGGARGGARGGSSGGNNNFNNNQRNNFNNHQHRRSMTFGGFNLTRNNNNDNTYPQSYIRENMNMGMNMGIGGGNNNNSTYTWQQQQQFAGEINNLIAQHQISNLQQEVSNMEMIQQRLHRSNNNAANNSSGSLLQAHHLHNNNNNNNNRGSMLRGRNNFGNNRSSGRDGFWRN